MKELEEKYIELILRKCLNFDDSKSLMINCDFKEHIPFALRVKEKANEMWIFDACINDFYIEFKDGKAVSCYAKEGQKTLEKIITSEEKAAYLGEVALVAYASPISNTGLVFNQTLFDENASCHLALGRGFVKSIYNSKNLSEEELIKKGLNICATHVDFMIGTSDLQIEAETNQGKKLIFKKGNFNL